MTVEKLPPNEFIVKVRRGRMDRPVYMKRRAVMIFNHDQKDITFSYDNCCTILKAKFISQMPWSPPRGCTLRFMSDNRNEEEMILEFENHGKLIEAFSILKSKYLERSQFVYLSEPRSGRGLHTTAESAAERPIVDKTFSIVMESRRNRVKDHMFERLASPPSEKRSKQFEQPHKLMQTPIEERVKPPPLRSEGSENIRRNQRDAMFVEYSKREHTALKLTSAMRTLDDYKITKSNISSEKVSGFANLGNTCYMNAMLQALFAMDIFARDLFKLCKKVQNRNVDLEEVMPMSSALSNLASIRDRVSYHQKRELLKVIKDVSRFKDCAQQDANEFLIHVLNQVHDECDRLLHEQYGIADAGERRKRNPVMANFAFTTRSTVVCDVCHHVSQTDEDSIILPVTINVLEQANERFSKKFLRFPSVQTLLDEYLKTENVERKCEVCEGNIGQRTQKFVQLPRCLIIFIKRYTYDVSRSVKRDDKVDIPLYLTLNGHCAESSAPCLAIPTSTKKIDFATTSPIKMKLSTISIDPPSSARRRLDLSDEITNHDARKVSIAKEAMTSRYNRPMEYRTVWTNTAANHCMDFVIPGIDSNLKDEDQVTEDFVVPRNSTDEQSKSSSSLICKELSHVDEEEQLQVNDESEVLRGLIENSYNDCVENSKQERRSSDTGIFEETNEQDGRNRQKVKPVIQQKERNGVEEYTETNSGVELGITNVTKEVAMKETFEETHIRSLAQSAIAANQLEEQGQDGRLIEQIVVKNFGIPCSVQRKTTLSSIENRKTQTPTRPSSPISSITLTSMIGHYREKVLHRSTSNDDTREILEESGMQLVPYKPMSAEKRRAICSQIGLLFNYDCIEGTTVRIMSPNDRPSRVAGIVGDGNCLFRALAFYFAGSDNEHSRVRKCIVEFEAEHWNEFATLKVAAMLNVDVWTYYDQRWICYRPRFKVQNGGIMPISICDYRLGDNDGIYLLNEFNHFTPVLEPSNALLVMEGADERICDLIINANEGFMKPSYRLISVISHLGNTSESGHYVCDIWCKKNKDWLLCDDESVSPITETRIRAKNNVGYIYFYLNSELFESENA
ncbi:Ubiquitin carboxyl-terminal hydrolase [Dirofilaria immitis]